MINNASVNFGKLRMVVTIRKVFAGVENVRLDKLASSMLFDITFSAAGC